jgi:hypothetical protein
MSIVSCSLSCSESAISPGAAFNCNITEVYVNQDIRVQFSSEVDILSVTNNTFQVTSQGTSGQPGGMTPPGEFSIDPNDPTVLVYRPMITFDSSGNPIFGLTDGTSYILDIPGTILDTLGPYVKGKNGANNSSRLQCSLNATLGVFDTNPGSPLVTPTVTQVFPGEDGVIGTEDDVFLAGLPAANAVDVASTSPITLLFNDVMNPGVLVNPVTQTSDFIEVYVVAEGGDPSNPSDQSPVDGIFLLVLDQDALRTTVTFVPAGTGYPSGDSGSRRVFVHFSPLIADLGGNFLINGEDISFVPQTVIFEPIVVLEDFMSPQREDQLRTGNTWDGGMLLSGPGGGSGRLGDLTVSSGEVVELSTDSEDFSGVGSLEIFNPTNVIDRPEPFVVEGGLFEFARLRVDPGGTLRFTGSNPVRLYVRGEASIQGQIDLSGSSGLIHTGTEPNGLGGIGGQGGPGGGSGGSGGLRPDGTDFVSVQGVPNPGAGPHFVTGPDYSLLNGEHGLGLLFPDTSVGPGGERRAGGEGGLAWPQPTASNPSLNMPRSVGDVFGLELEYLYNCIVATPGAPGGGGGYALSGLTGMGNIIDGSISTTEPPPGFGGDSETLMLGDPERSLDPDQGYLRGGSGGGGGGSHVQLTKVNGIPLDPATHCSVDISGDATSVEFYRSHSGAGGGGGGGGIQITSGRRTVLTGVLSIHGGDGGSFDSSGLLQDPPALGQAGGAGAGGAVLLQSRQLQLQAIPSRIDVRGGIGGVGPFDSIGGAGGPGLVRLEAETVPDFEGEKAKIVPTPGELEDLYDSDGELLFQEVLSTGVWTPIAEGPSGFSGAQSCWIQPEGNFFRLQFKEDDPAEGDLGWDIKLRFADQEDLQSFRGANDIMEGDLESFMGNDFGSGAVIVRFQGARAVGSLLDPCSVPETGVSSPMVGGSLTDWVSHPAELNSGDGNPTQSPNIFRFVILWDRSDPNFEGLAGRLEGATDLAVTLIPD